MSTSKQILGLLAWLAVTFAAAAVGAVASAQSREFYAQLDRPAWSPPGWVFGPVWTLLYALMAIAAEFNRYNVHRLVVEDPELGAQRFGGKFPANDFAGLVRLLELNFGVVSERRENETVLRRRPGGR